MTVIKLQDENEIYRYRNMLFRLYHAFSDYRDMIIENGGSDPEGWDTEVYPLTSTYTFNVKINF